MAASHRVKGTRRGNLTNRLRGNTAILGPLEKLTGTANGLEPAVIRLRSAAALKPLANLGERAKLRESTDATVSVVHAPSAEASPITGVGYVAGGYSTGTLSSMERFAFIDESASSIAAVLSLAREQTAATQSAIKGYCAGGYDGGSNVADIDGIVFATEAAHNPAGALSVTKVQHTAFASSTKGYFASGSGSTGIDGMTFGSETSAAIGATLPEVQATAAGLNSATMGYVACGYQYIQAIRRLRYSDETITTISAGANNYRESSGVSAPAVDRGYIFGGNDSAVWLSLISSFGFTSETSVSISAVLANARNNGAGLYSSVNGYYTGGGGGYDDIDGIAFLTNTAINPSAALTTGRYTHGGMSSPSDLPLLLSDTKNGTVSIPPKTGAADESLKFGGGGYFAGDSGSGFVYSLDFLSLTCGIVANWGYAQVATAGVSSSTAGFFCGGQNSGNAVRTIQQLTYADATVASTTNALSTGRWLQTGVQSSTDGYIAGGQTTGTTMRSEIEKIDYAGVSGSTIAATLSVARGRAAGVSSSSTGFFLGGESVDGTTDTDEIDGLVFSNDTATNPAAVLAASKLGATGTASSTDGFVAGGYDFSASYVSAIERYQFSNNTINAVTATLNVARFSPGGASSSTTGYYAAGDSGAGSTEIDGIVFSTETAVNPSATLLTSGGITGVSAPPAAVDVADSSKIGASYVYGDNAESATGTDAAGVTMSSAVSRSESTSVADAIDGIKNLFSAIANTLTSTADALLDVVFASAGTAFATAADAKDASWTTPSAGTASASASDTKDAAFSNDAAAVETMSLASAQGVTVVFVASDAATLTAADSKDASGSSSSGITESATAADSPSSARASNGDLPESVSATDDGDGILLNISASVESATAAAAPSVVALYLAGRTETIYAAATANAMQYNGLYGERNEFAAAFDDPSVTAVHQLSASVSASAASTQSMNPVYAVAASAGVTAAETAGAQAVLIAYGVGAANSQDAPSALAILAVYCDDLVSASDTASSSAQLYAATLHEVLSAIASAFADILPGKIPTKFVIRAFTSIDFARAMTQSVSLRAESKPNRSMVTEAAVKVVRVLTKDTTAVIKTSTTEVTEKP